MAVKTIENVIKLNGQTLPLKDTGKCAYLVEIPYRGHVCEMYTNQKLKRKNS